MSKTIVLQAQHSRNSHDWTMTKLASGRHAFVANKKGVNLRIGLLLNFLGENPASSTEEMAAYLYSVDSSYTDNDVSQPMRQMRKLGMVNAKGKGRATTYTLTPNGRTIWAHITRKWIGG